MSRPVLAVDIGGTKLAAALVDADGNVSCARRVATPAGEGVDAETLWETVLHLLREVTGSAGGVAPAGVGVGCGGPMVWPEGAVSPLNIPAWRGFPLRRRLQECYPGVPVRLHNDALCLAAAEHWRGAGRGHRNVLGMVVSTGVGGGLVLDGHLFDGSSGNAGHIGHVTVDPDGPCCECGGRGCLEAVARGPAAVAWAQERGWRVGATASGAELTSDARAGDPVARAALARSGAALGIAVASVAHLLDLDVVAIGGGLSQAGELLFGPLEESRLAHLGLDFARRCRVVPAQLGQQAGLVGAAALIHRGDDYWSAG